MPIPSKKRDEEPTDFMSRCMGDDKMKEEYKSQKQRTAICMSKACEDLAFIEISNLLISYEYGFTEEITEANFILPNEEDYVDFGEEEFKWDADLDKTQNNFKYKDPKTGEIYTYKYKGLYKKNGRTLVPVAASEYQSRKVKLNKPFRTPDGPKKMSVYVKNDKGNVVKVNFGDPDMEIKRDNPARRKSFRARHNCDNPGPKWKARYWSCKAW